MSGCIKKKICKVDLKRPIYEQHEQKQSRVIFYIREEPES